MLVKNIPLIDVVMVGEYVGAIGAVYGRDDNFNDCLRAEKMGLVLFLTDSSTMNYRRRLVGGKGWGVFYELKAPIRKKRTMREDRNYLFKGGKYYPASCRFNGDVEKFQKDMTMAKMLSII